MLIWRTCILCSCNCCFSLKSVWYTGKNLHWTWCTEYNFLTLHALWDLLKFFNCIWINLYSQFMINFSVNRQLSISVLFNEFSTCTMMKSAQLCTNFLSAKQRALESLISIFTTYISLRWMEKGFPIFWSISNQKQAFRGKENNDKMLHFVTWTGN